MKTTTFCVSNLTNTDLSNLIAECQREIDRREQHRATERKRWVESCYYAFMAHPAATSIQVDNVTVVSIFNRNTGMHMGTARPVHGDTFDRAVGIAVAYAKAIGMTIPDYI